MGKKKYQAPGEDSQTDFVPEVELAPADDAVLLKVNHTHAGTQYPKGTKVSDLNASDLSLAYMRNNGVI